MVQAKIESKDSENSTEKKKTDRQAWVDKHGGLIIGLSLLGLIALMGLIMHFFG